MQINYLHICISPVIGMISQLMGLWAHATGNLHAFQPCSAPRGPMSPMILGDIPF